MKNMKIKRIARLTAQGAVVAATAMLMINMARAADFNEDEARALMKKSGCFKCHSLTREKDAPPYKEIAKKLKSKPDPEKELYTHLTTNPMVEVEGKKEKHDSLKTKDEAQIKNVIHFILAQ